jgi:putative transcriptional regulator
MTPLRRIREAKNYSLAEVAEGTFCDRGNLSRIETCKQKPSLDLAAALVNFFNKEITEMEILYPERFMSKEELSQLNEKA